MRTSALAAAVGLATLVSLAVPTLAAASQATPGQAASAPVRPGPAATPAAKAPPAPSAAAAQQLHGLVVQKCARCHPLERALDPSYTVADWRASLRRMVRLPGAGISEDQAAAIFEYLRAFAAKNGHAEKAAH